MSNISPFTQQISALVATARSMSPMDHARLGHVQFFRSLDENVLMNSRGDLGESVLMEAAKWNQLDCCKEIYSRNSSLVYHQHPFFRVTALHVAAEETERSEIVEFLLYADAYTKAQDHTESERRGEMIANKKLLLMLNAERGTALHVAVTSHNIEAAKILIQADPSNEQLGIVDLGKKTALHYAVEIQIFEIVKSLVDHKPDIVYRDDHSGSTPLLTAMRLAIYGDTNSVNIRKLLIEKQANQIMVPSGVGGWTLLHLAAMNGDVGAIEDILQFCPDCLELTDRNGMNFLHLAAINGHVNVVKYILKIKDIPGTILNGQDNFGNTPLHSAAMTVHASTVLCLIYDTKVSKTIKNRQGRTAPEMIYIEYDKDRAEVFGVRDAVDEEELKDQSDFDLVVCALIATISFTAGLTVPGGYINDGPNKGMAVLSKKKVFGAFIIANTWALLLSLSAVFCHFCTRLMLRKKDISLLVKCATVCTLGAILTMVVTFVTGSYAVLANSEGLAITVCASSGTFFVLATCAICKVAIQYKKLTRGASASLENRSLSFPS